jgi:hypothetical protein
VLADQARYDNAWCAILADPVENAAVVSLGQYALERQAACKTLPLQLNRTYIAPVAPVAIDSSADSEGETSHQQGRLVSALVNVTFAVQSLGNFSRCTSNPGLLDCGVDGILDPNSPVYSIDQLFFQAITLSPILITKVQGWAAVSDGYFSSAATDAVGGSKNCRADNSNRGTDANHSNYDSVEDGDCYAGFVRWLDVVDKELHTGGQVHWAKVKSVQRSIEKSTRSYGKVLSWLVSLCLC